MRTRLPTCLSIGFGAFLAMAITISYAAAVLSNVPAVEAERNLIPSLIGSGATKRRNTSTTQSRS
jgi:hypothetical protein